MEAATLPNKKTTISKGKLKKSIKNVLCRPDPVSWPLVSENDGKKIIVSLNKLKIPIPEYKKPHWKEIKGLPKDKRPKAPVLKKIDGLIFGVSECSTAVQKGECSALIIESSINPRTLVLPTLEACHIANIPVLCLNNLRGISLENFGISTSCLGIKNSCLLDLKNEILKISKSYKPTELNNKIKIEKMEVDEESNNSTMSKENPNGLFSNPNTECPYLFRTNKQNRVFVPTEGTTTKTTKHFIGQDFIEFSEKKIPNSNKQDSKSYMKMIVKRISNNPNRSKRK